MFSVSKFLGVEKDNEALLYRAYLAFFCSGMMTNVLGAILPYMGENYGFSYAFRGTLSSINQMGNLLAVWLSGFLPFMIGRKNSTLLLGSGIVIGLVIMALTGNPLFVALAFILVGLGRGTMSNITNVIVGQYTANKSAGLNLLHATFAVGAVASPFIVAFLGSDKWRWPVLAIALMMVVSLVLLATSKLENKKSVKAKDESAIPTSFDFWLNTAILFFYLCCEASLMNWLVTYFRDSGIFNVAISTIMSSLLWLMILLGRLICAYLSSRIRNKSYLILLMGLMVTGFFILMLTATKPAFIMVGVLGTGFSMSGIYPTTLSTQAKKYNKSTIATGTCIASATLGSIIMPGVIGTVAEGHGIEAGMATILIALVLMIALMIVKVFYTKYQIKNNLFEN